MTDSAEDALLTTTVQTVVDKHVHDPDSISGALDELGVWEIDCAGRRRVVAAALDAEVRHSVVSPLLNEAMVRAVDPDAATDAVFVLPLGPEPSVGTVDGGRATLRGLALAPVLPRTRLLVPLRADAGSVIASIAAELTLPVPVAGLPGTCRASRIDASGISFTPVTGQSGTAEPGPAWWGIALCYLATQLLALAGELHRAAVAHVQERHQFGRPLSSFQTVRHRLAQVTIAVEATSSLLDRAWRAQATERFATIALGANALAAEAFDTAHRHCMQVMGGMGISLEHPAADLHRVGILLARIGGSTDDKYRTLSQAPFLSRYPDPSEVDID